MHFMLVNDFKSLIMGCLRRRKIDEAIFSMQISLSLVRICNSLSLASIAGCFIFFFCYVTFCACKARVIFLPAEQTLPSSKKKSSLIFWDIFYYFWPFSQCLKVTQNVVFESFNFGIFHQFWPIKTDLSGNSVWPQALGFQKLAKLAY